MRIHCWWIWRKVCAKQGNGEKSPFDSSRFLSQRPPVKSINLTVRFSRRARHEQRTVVRKGGRAGRRRRAGVGGADHAIGVGAQVPCAKTPPLATRPRMAIAIGRKVLSRRVPGGREEPFKHVSFPGISARRNSLRSRWALMDVEACPPHTVTIEIDRAAGLVTWWPWLSACPACGSTRSSCRRTARRVGSRRVPWRSRWARR